MFALSFSFGRRGGFCLDFHIEMELCGWCRCSFPTRAFQCVCCLFGPSLCVMIFGKALYHMLEPWMIICNMTKCK